MEQISNISRKYINPKIIHQHNINITKIYDWVVTEVDKKPDILSCSVDDLFYDINYTTFNGKEKVTQEFLSSREKYYRCKDIVYDIVPPKTVLL